jgi:hypothetical protein
MANGNAPIKTREKMQRMTDVAVFSSGWFCQKRFLELT